MIWAMELSSLPNKENARPRPVVLAYPRVYENLSSPAWRYTFNPIIAKCFELANKRPAPEKRHGGFFGLGRGDRQRLALFTVWAIEPTKPDIFILSGSNDGFGPGDTCPSEDDLRRGIYGELRLVPLL